MSPAQMTASQASSSSIDAASRATWPIMGQASPASSAISAKSGLATVSPKERSYIAGAAPTAARDGSILSSSFAFTPDPGDSTQAPPGRVKAGVEVLRSLDMDRLSTLTLSDDEGRDVRVRDLWAERPAALVFLRHYG